MAKSTDDLLASIPEGVNAGSTWQHRKGGVYEVLCIALDEATHAPVVVYQCRASQLCWTRPYAEFTDGRFTVLYAA